MPKKLLLISSLLLFINLFLVKNISFAQTPTAPKSIKFGIFTPPPTRTPTQTPAPSLTAPAKPTPTGQPQPTDKPDGSKANEVIDLVNQIRQHCTNGVVYNGNIDCIDNLVLPANVAGEVKYEIRFSVDWNTYLQCVGFVRAATT